MKKKVLLLETVAEDAQHILNQSDIEQITSFDQVPSGNWLSEIDAIITRGKGQVRESLLSQCTNLQIVARCGVGLDNIDVSSASQKGIKVVNAPNSNAHTIAEHTLALMLSLQRNLHRSVSEVKEENWGWRAQFQGDEIRGKTLGILGMGNIGSKVADLANAFGMRVVFWNRDDLNTPYSQHSLDEVLELSDIITIHLPLTDETNLLINEEAINKMKKGVFLINTARGAIIDEVALISALNSGQVAGFAADVLTTEPPENDSALVQHPNTQITAHVGSLTSTTYTKMCVDTVNNVLALLEGKAPTPGCIFNQADLPN